MSKQVKGESDKIAQMVLVAAAGGSFFIVGLVLVIFHNYQIAEKTGTLGDTIGGIAGPILNFAGLYIIYLSLREQFEANEIQKESHSESEKREYRIGNLEVCLNLIDRLTTQAKNQNDKVEKLRAVFNSKEYSITLAKLHVVEYMRTMDPILVMCGTIRQLVGRSDFDRNQMQAVAFVLRYEFLPQLDYLYNLLMLDKIQVGEDTILFETQSIGRMLKRINGYKNWVLVSGALVDNALNEWLT